MTTARRLALDANILMRGVLGRRVGQLLEAYESTVSFYTADVCVEDARLYLPDVVRRRGLDSQMVFAMLDQILSLVQTVDVSLYNPFEIPARERIGSRDVDDWPVIATALLLDCPIWTEDQDFFGSGVATWTTQNIELYLRT